MAKMETPEEWFSQNADRVVDAGSLKELNNFMSIICSDAWSKNGFKFCDYLKFGHKYDYSDITFLHLTFYNYPYKYISQTFLDRRNMRLISFKLIGIDNGNRERVWSYEARIFKFNDEFLTILPKLEHKNLMTLGDEIKDQTMTFKDYFPINNKAKSARKTLN